VQRFKGNGRFTLNAKFGDGWFQTALGKFFKAFL
jgi:hypothetical protein